MPQRTHTGASAGSDQRFLKSSIAKNPWVFCKTLPQSFRVFGVEAALTFPYGNILVFSLRKARLCSRTGTSVDFRGISSLVRASSTPVMRETPGELAPIKGEVGDPCPSRPPFMFSRLLGVVLKPQPQSNPHLSDR